MKRVLVFCSGFFMLLGVSGGVLADDKTLMETVLRLEKRIDMLEKKVAVQEEYIARHRATIDDQQAKISDYESRLSRLDEQLHRQTGEPIPLIEGLDIGVGATLVVQGTNNVNDATSDVEKKVSRVDGTYSVDLTFGKEFEGTGGRAFAHLEAGQGAGLEDNLTLYSNVNRDADNDNNVRVTEAWYEQSLFKDSMVVTVGKLDPSAYFDNNEVANDETTQFLGRIFRNSPVIELPDNTIGVRTSYMPFSWVELSCGLFDGKGDWEKIGDSLFTIGQAAFKTRFFGQPGNYRVYGWHTNKYHTRWLDTSKTKESAYGFGLSVDQKVNDTVTFFCRYGWQDPEVYDPDATAVGDLNFSLEQSWSAGIQCEGKNWGRENDVLGLAVGQIMPSDDYKKADATRQAKNEGHLELYYRIYFNEHLSISPDLQYIWNPFGKDVAGDTNGIVIGGMRAQVDF